MDRSCQAWNGRGKSRKILCQVGFEDWRPLPDPRTRARPVPVNRPVPAFATRQREKNRRNPRASRFECTPWLSVDHSTLATWRHPSARLHPFNASIHTRGKSLRRVGHVNQCVRLYFNLNLTSVRLFFIPVLILI